MLLLFTAIYVAGEQNITKEEDGVYMNETSPQYYDNNNYKCVFFNVKYCIIIDNVLYMLIAMNIMLVAGLIVYFIINIYKFCSIYNNFNEAKKMFMELKATSKI